MEENQRFRNVITSLKENKRVRNQQDFVERIGSDKTTISQIVNNKIMIPNNLFAKIKEAFPGSNLEMANCLIAPLFKPIRMGIISMDSR